MQLLLQLQGNSVYNVPDIVQDGSQKSTHSVSCWVKSDREGEISCDILYMWNLKRNDTNELTYKTERFTDLASSWLPGDTEEGQDAGIVREFGWDWHVHTAMLKMDNQ